MYAAVISTLVFASPGASAFSGSRTDSVLAASAVGRGSADKTPTSDPSADYWHALAVKRLRLWRADNKRMQRRIRVLVLASRGRVYRSSGRVGDSHSIRGVICSVFGSHCSEAIHVAQCESHLNVYARNGQYLGLFQFGSFARAHYGFAWDALTQTRAAYRYFLDAGWSPWTCRP